MRCLFKSGLILAAALFVGDAKAAEILDQNFVAGFGSNSVATIYGPPANVSTAETFTVGISGILSRVAVEVSHYPGAGDLSVRILTTTNGVPDTASNSVLGLATVPASSVPNSQGLISVPLTGPAIHVTPDEVLAIALSIDTTNGTSYQWYGEVMPQVPYVGGTTFQEYSNTNGQWKSEASLTEDGAKGYSYASGFQTYVTAPEPGAWGAIVMAGSGAITRRRRIIDPLPRT